jgi:thiosulfate reductase cytochrome b subunit
MYRTYERAWHWLQALAILLLLVTGIEIHVTRIGLIDFALAVRVHNIVGFVVLANAIFAAFYHVASGEIQQYLPRPQGFFGQAITQARYYLSGIFRGQHHPFEKSPGRKLNPLQQLTYLGILNVLLPLQIVTGVLIWGAQRWPAVDGVMGGLVFLAPLHALGAWLFAAFLLMHVYLTTTGPTPLANIQAMVVGWEGMETVDDKAEAV